MMIELEPGRCRRTDGKKWRCSKEVLPQQKYCESHIHRGRKRARKHSEAALDTTSSTTSTKLSESLSNPPHVTPTATIKTLVNYVKNNANVNDIDRKKDNIVESLFATSGQIFSLDDNNNNGDKRKRSENGYGDVKSSDCNNSVRNKFNLESMNKGDKSHGNVEARIIGFPPRSNLLVGGTSITGNTLLSEERRCRRTDGKKWRCSREVVTNKKYCVSHMHRGAKRIAATGLRGAKRVAASGLLGANMFVAPLTVAKREEEEGTFVVPPAVAKREEEDEVNTQLCISSATNLELIRRRSSPPSHSNGSSSDSTTITDERGCLCP